MSGEKMTEKPWEEMSSDEKDAEWYALPDREKTQFYRYRDAREELKRLRDYIDRALADYKYPADLIGRVAAIRRNVDEWAGQRWTDAVNELPTT
jgi:hypothetical protein